MNKEQSNKIEVIEQALQEAVGGGMIPVCGISCHIFSKDVCNIDLFDAGPARL